jgi:hypothetical protein
MSDEDNIINKAESAAKAALDEAETVAKSAMNDAKSALDGAETAAKAALNDAETAAKSAMNGAETAAKAALGDKLAGFMSLKDNNPKLFYGIIAVLVLPILFMMIGGGEKSSTVSGPVIKDLVIGQKYVLKSPNTVDTDAKIRLVPVPGTLSAYDDTEEEDRKDTKDAVCQHMPQGTPVEVTEFSDAFGKKKMFAKVKITEGSCKDKDGWVLAIDVQ